MDEINQHPSQINRSKRKFEDDILELPIAKHTCLEKISTPSNVILERNSGKILLQMSNEILHTQGSGIDSNNFSEDTDSVMSLTSDNDCRMKQQICPYDAPHSSSSSSSSSSVNWIGRGKTFDRLETKTCDEMYGYMCPSFELDCEFSISRDEAKQTEENEALMEDLFCSNKNGNDEFLSNNYILSSGRWNVNQDTEQGAEKLTIDKEFEQYFSMLML